MLIDQEIEFIADEYAQQMQSEAREHWPKDRDRAGPSGAYVDRLIAAVRALVVDAIKQALAKEAASAALPPHFVSETAAKIMAACHVPPPFEGQAHNAVAAAEALAAELSKRLPPAEDGSDGSIPLINLYEMAARCRVRAAWLRGEAEVGRVPCLVTGPGGRQMLFDPAAVQHALLDRARELPQGPEPIPDRGCEPRAQAPETEPGPANDGGGGEPMIADTNAIRQTAELAKRRPQAPLFVVFEGSPGPGNECVFVEVEDEAGNGCGFAWRERSDGRWALGPFYPAP